MKYEHANNSVSTEVLINNYLAQTTERQRDVWLMPEHTANFPRIVMELLSPEGMDTYPPDTRAAFYRGALGAFATYPHTRQAEKYIPTSSVTYNVTTDEIGQVGNGQYPNDVTPLFHIDLAGTLALGMSLPNHEEAMSDYIRAYDKTLNKNWFSVLLGRLVTTNSTARHWVKQHDLDATAGHEWDKTLATVMMNLPEHVIVPETGQPKMLPRALTLPEAHVYYSAAAMDVFLAYAAHYAEQIKCTARARKELLEFTLWVRKMPGNFLQDIERQINLLTVLAATNNPPVKDNSGRLISARDYLEYHAPHRSRERFISWYNRGVQELQK